MRELTYILYENVFILKGLHEDLHDEIEMTDILPLLVNQVSQVIIIAQSTGLRRLGKGGRERKRETE